MKQQYYRTQGSKNRAVKSRVKENRVKYFQNFLLFSFFSWRKATNSPVPGKIFIDPIAAAFLSPCEHLAHREFPTAVTCLCPGFGTKPSQVSLNFHSFKTFSHLPLMQLCGLATGLHRGQAGMGTGCFQRVRTARSCPGWAATLWDRPGEAVTPPPALAPTLQHKDSGSRAAPALLTLPHQTRWFLPPTATCSPSCFLLRQRNQTEEHQCHRYLRKGSHPG